MGAPFEIPEAAEAQAIHKRRALARAAEHGIALLEALRLPRLVTGDFDTLDPVAIDFSVRQAIAALDAIDGDPDFEDDGTAEGEPDEETSLETAGRGFVRCGADDAEQDDEPEDDELGDEHADPEAVFIFGPKRNAEADQQAFTAWLAAAEVAHACG